jgi:GH43 family beta-xylosidase
VLLGKSDAQRKSPLFWRRPPDRPGTKAEPNPDLAVRESDWKLFCNVDGSATRLYNLARDIGEQQDVADQHPVIAGRLQTAVLAWNTTLPTDGVGNAEARQTRGKNARKVSALPVDKFVNPIAEGADPSVAKDGNRYLWCQSEGNAGVSIWVSDRPNSMGRKHVIWRAPKTGPISKQVWAPELIKLDDRWYVYFAASDGENENHLTYVLASKTADPLGQYTLHGPLYTGDNFDSKTTNIWAIDMTVMQQRGKLFAIWSGWSNPTSDLQYLYIAPMKSPTELAGPRVQICESDDYLWERIEEKLGTRGLHEGPQLLSRGDRTFLVYSCAASWLPTYKLGMLELVGDDPLDPQSWKKFPEPVFRSTANTYGVGHGGFVTSPDNTEWWHIYHAKMDTEPGWRRAVYVQPMKWTPDGLPVLGTPVDAGAPLDLPSGTPSATMGGQRKLNFREPAVMRQLDYYGHNQLLDHSDRGVALGRMVDDPINLYRCGEKMIVRDAVYDDMEIVVDFSFVDGDRDAGILFRTTGPAVGYDAQRGYFAGLIPSRETVVLGKTDGRNWHHLVDTKVEIDVAKPQQLRVRGVGDRIEVFVNGSDAPAISTRDGDYASGSVGPRVVNTHAVFHDLSVTPIAK